MCVSKRAPRRCVRLAKTADDYRKLADSRGFLWQEDTLPQNVNEQTRWVCRADAEHIKFVSFIVFSTWVKCCPFCAEKVLNTVEAYRELAERRGFIWNEKQLPATPKQSTRWICKVNPEHIKHASYLGFAQKVNDCKECTGGPQRLKRKYKEDYRKLADSRGFSWNEAELPANTATRTRWVCKENPGHVRFDSYCMFSRRIEFCPRCAAKRRKRRVEIRTAPETSETPIAPEPSKE